MRAACTVLAATLIGALFACYDINSKGARAAYVTTGGGNAWAGRNAIRKYGCYSCHTIAGIPEARGLVGPPLNGVATRQYIAGQLPNSAANLMRWIEHPHQVAPHTLMPEMGVTEQDSRDIAAYLYTLRNGD